MQLIIHPVPGGENFLVDVPAGALVDVLRADVAGKLGVAPEQLSLQFGARAAVGVAFLAGSVAGGGPKFVALTRRAAVCRAEDAELRVGEPLSAYPRIVELSMVSAVTLSAAGGPPPAASDDAAAQMVTQEELPCAIVIRRIPSAAHVRARARGAWGRARKSNFNCRRARRRRRARCSKRSQSSASCAA